MEGKKNDPSFNVKRDELIARLQGVEVEIWGLICHLERKMRCPDTDGQYSNMINASTDVIPELHRFRSIIFGTEN